MLGPQRPEWAPLGPWVRIQKAFPGCVLLAVDDLGLLMASVRPGSVPLAPRGPDGPVFMYDPALIEPAEALEMLDVTVRSHEMTTARRAQATINAAARVRAFEAFYPHDKRRKPRCDSSSSWPPLPPELRP